jgi:hypothetical protein
VPAARVVFAPSTSVARLSELLRRHHARVVSGPTEAGVYTLTFAPQPSAVDGGGAVVLNQSETSLDQTSRLQLVEASIAALRSESDVLFAEPVLTSDGAPR